MSLLKEEKIKEFFKNPNDRFINREISWLKFNERVLEEALNSNVPLLERVKFLSISASNLDEFYMVRVAGVKAQLEHGVDKLTQDGLTPLEQLNRIYLYANELIKRQQNCWKLLCSELEKEKVSIVNVKDLTEEEYKYLEKQFIENIFPTLTPITIDPAHPFPVLANLGITIIGKIKNQSDNKISYIIIPLPQKLERFIRVESSSNKYKFILSEEVVISFSRYFFKNTELLAAGIVHVARDSELQVSEGAEDLLRAFEWAMEKRFRANVIKLEVSTGLTEDLIELVKDQLDVSKEDIIDAEEIVNLASIKELYDLPEPSLKFKPYKVRFPERIDDFNGDFFKAIDAKDLIIHHPYESFEVVISFLKQAAKDPDVIAIKQTLYRTSDDSEIVKALIEAAKAGKSVTAVVELKARFNEETNIKWAHDLEDVGAQVVYGLVGLKTHAKASLVIRRTTNGTKSYVHFGTGNYHPITAKSYADLSFFSSDPEICKDAGALFNYLTTQFAPTELTKLTLAPIHLRQTLLDLIQKEVEFARLGKPANIWIKVNALVDDEMIDALYYASQQGVNIELVVRGICSLKPGIKGFSENIKVKSIIGRFLEHTRIFVFGNGHKLPSKKAKVFISSADWMYRNLTKRVEVMVPIENPTVHEQVMNQIMVANLKDERQSWQLNSDGNYIRVNKNKDSICAHDFFIKNPSLSGRGSALLRDKKKFFNFDNIRKIFNF
jgi:polyphosphate kinase